MDSSGLPVIQTERLGFRTLAGDAKVQLTPNWSPPPAPTASLLAIASRSAIVAAVGPDALYISSTDSVRKAFETPKNGDSDIRPYEGHTKLPMPMRISHIAFTSDERYLIMAAEQGGGLAIYETQMLSQGTAQSVFEIGTSGEAIKTLVPNPMAELAELCAVVTTNGNLLMANLKEKGLASGSNGPVLRAGVTSVGWSTKGKQLVAGLAEGSIVQMTPDGTEKAVIPKPSSLVNHQVASISWLENHVFLAVYTNAADPQSSSYFVITRSAPAKQAPSFEYRKLQDDPVQSFGNQLPPHYTILRLRDYPPAIQELLVVASSVSDSLGVLTKAKASLATSDFPPEQATNIFTVTEFTEDSRRAQLPSDQNLDDTTPIGVALDLSSKDKVYKPVPDNEEIELSPGPLPGVWVLSNQGVLCAWWVAYYDAIREGKTFPALAELQGGATQPTAAASAKPTAGTFGSQPSSSPFGGSSAFSKPSPASSNPFGTPPAATSGPAFGTPAFGSTSAIGATSAPTAFGQHGGLGTKVSPWATASTSAAPAFGSHGFSGSVAPTTGTTVGSKVFGGGAAASTTGGGFAGLAGQSGFAGLAANKGGDSIFSKPASSSPFGTATSGQSAFGGSGNSNPFGNNSGAGTFGSQQPPSTSSGSVFSAPTATAKQGPSFGGSPFVLGTTFKADPATANDNEKPSGKGGFSLGGFGLSLDAASSKPTEPTESKDENMDTETPIDQQKTKSLFDPPQGSTTPTSTPAPAKVNANPFAAPATTSNIFGSTKPQVTPPKFNPFAQTDKPKASASPFGSLFGGNSDKPGAADAAADEPLPPDTTSKTVYPFGESSSSSISSTKTTEESKKPSESVEDAPLPPDFVAPKSKQSEPETAPPPLPKDDSPIPEEAPLPPTSPKIEAKKPLSGEPTEALVPESPDDSHNDESSETLDSDGDGEEDEGSVGEDHEGGSEGSGIDVAKDLSPSSVEAGQTPHSSFGGMGGSAFSLVSGPHGSQPPRPSMFGAPAPGFSNSARDAPRSPSPVRAALKQNMFLGGGSKSVSAASGAIRPQSSIYSKSVGGRVEPREDPNIALQREAQKKQAEQEEHCLEDDEYEHVQADLERPIEPTLEIGEFNAYISVTADAHASTVAAQVEALYRDMNGMLLTLGTNARVLGAFIKGHEQPASDEAKTKNDLDNSDDWVLCEAEDLDHILVNELALELEDARVQDVRDTWDTCQDLVRELPKLHAKRKDLKRILDSVLDPDQADAARQAQLSSEQTAQRNALRHGYARVTKLMAEAESALTMLKTKLATLSGTPSAQPTVEAIMRTIGRMTTAAEKRSGDIDIIESQMRKLRVTGSAAPSASREGTPDAFRTPTPNKRSSLSRTLSGASAFSPSPMRSSTGSASRGGPSPRKKMSGFTAEDKDVIREKREKRQAVLDRLRGKLVENGPKVSRMGDTR